MPETPSEKADGDEPGIEIVPPAVVVNPIGQEWGARSA
jgi:hypothetical protein